MPNVEIEFDREAEEIVLSARSGSGNFTLKMPYAGAATLAAAANQAVGNEQGRYMRARFTLPTAELEVCLGKSPAVQHK